MVVNILCNVHMSDYVSISRQRKAVWQLKICMVELSQFPMVVCLDLYMVHLSSTHLSQLSWVCMRLRIVQLLSITRFVAVFIGDKINVNQSCYPIWLININFTCPSQGFFQDDDQEGTILKYSYGNGGKICTYNIIKFMWNHCSLY